MIIVPSRRRIERLKRFFQSAKETNTTSPITVLVDSRDYLDNCDAYLNLEMDYMVGYPWRTVVTSQESMGDKVREAWGIYKDLNWICLLNDDHVFRTKEWDKRLISQLDGTNFLSCSDGWKTDGKKTLPAGATMWSGDLIRAVGYIFPNRLNHMFIDNVWMDLGKATGSWLLDESVVVEHEHATRMDEWKDDTHKKSESFLHGDGLRYVEWRDGGEKDLAIQAIRRLKDGKGRIQALRPLRPDQVI